MRAVHEFQSTLPREERPYAFILSIVPKGNFNPRSHERSDSSAFFIALEIIISIHAPTRGATQQARQLIVFLIFQSTLPREERRIEAIYICTDCDFNPRSHERSDLGIYLR